jgi:hypothetical protein
VGPVKNDLAGLAGDRGVESVLKITAKNFP